MRVLFVEDDRNLGFLLKDFLESKGAKVDLYRDGISAYNAFVHESYDFCLFDVMLPEMDGFSLARKVKAKNKAIPIIFLTARSMKPDKLKGYELGADDYITKPFDEDELWCKMMAIRNRSRVVEKSKDEGISIGTYWFDPQNLSLERDGIQRRLTSREAEVLWALCNEKGQVVRRENILESIWGANDYFAGRSLDVFISRLRKYLKDDPEVEIRSIVKVGYVLDCK